MALVSLNPSTSLSVLRHLYFVGCNCVALELFLYDDCPFAVVSLFSISRGRNASGIWLLPQVILLEDPYSFKC